RYPRAIGVIGGPICWSFDQARGLDRLCSFDYICVGDGEEMIPELLEALRLGARFPQVVRARRRFDLSKALPADGELLHASGPKYYGAVVEVSRGCPFLCEFCDIRVVEDNNRPHTKSPGLIAKELHFLAVNGVHQVILACDNFIGDAAWAEAVLD